MIKLDQNSTSGFFFLQSICTESYLPIFPDPIQSFLMKFFIYANVIFPLNPLSIPAFEWTKAVTIYCKSQTNSQYCYNSKDGWSRRDGMQNSCLQNGIVLHWFLPSKTSPSPCWFKTPNHQFEHLDYRNIEIHFIRSNLVPVSWQVSLLIPTFH